MAIRALGFEVKKADVLKIMKDYDREGKGKITFHDFSEVSKYKKHSQWFLIQFPFSIPSVSRPSENGF